MLRKRIIFSLIYANGYFHQSRNFRLQRVGDINWLEKNYGFKDIAFSLDELIVLNTQKSEKDMATFSQALTRLVDSVFIPIAAGGGIRSVEDAKLLFNSGADKIVLNSTLYNDPKLVGELVKRFGSQSIIASIDYKKTADSLDVYINDGTQKIEMGLVEYIHHVQTLEIGEIYLNSIDQDGTGYGYDFETISLINESVKVPLIIAGGAGNESHLIEGLGIDKVNAVATANLFNFVGNGLQNARAKVLEAHLNIADWGSVR